MKFRHSLIGVSLFLVPHFASAGTTSFGKNYGKDVPPPVVPDLSIEVPSQPRNRIGVLATGGLGISAEFLSDAFVKKDPKIPFDRIEREEDADFSPGFEVFYERLFSDPAETTHLWGLRVGLGYSHIEAEDRYNEIDAFGDVFTLEHELEADLIHLNVGPFYEHRFSDRFYAQVSAGLTAAYMNADLKTRDSTGLLDADSSEDDFLFGAYASLAIGYDIAPNWSLMGGIRYQYLDTFEIDNGITEAELDFDSAYFVFAGLRWAF